MAAVVARITALNKAFNLLRSQRTVAFGISTVLTDPLVPCARKFSTVLLRKPVVSFQFCPLRTFTASVIARMTDFWRNANGTRCLTSNSIVNSHCSNRLLQPKMELLQMQSSRTQTKVSWKKGTRKTVKAVIRRFYRLNWGGWIHVRPGRAKNHWQKSWKRKHRLRQHVFCNRTRTKMLDKMVTDFWKRPKYYVDDPYEPYQQRYGIVRRTLT